MRDAAVMGIGIAQVAGVEFLKRKWSTDTLVDQSRGISSQELVAEEEVEQHDAGEQSSRTMWSQELSLAGEEVEHQR